MVKERVCIVMILLVCLSSCSSPEPLSVEPTGQLMSGVIYIA